MRSLKCFLVSAVVLLSGEVCAQTVGVPRATFFESVPLNLGSEIRANLVNTLVGSSQISIVARSNDIGETGRLGTGGPDDWGDTEVRCVDRNPFDASFELHEHRPSDSPPPPWWQTYHPCSDKDRARPFLTVRYGDLDSSKPITGNPIVLSQERFPGLGRFLLLETGESCSPVPGPQAEPDPATRTPLCTSGTLLVNVGTPSLPRWVVGLRATNEGLRVERGLFDTYGARDFTFVINGHPVKRTMSGFIFGSRDINSYHVQVYEEPKGCRRYAARYAERDSIDVQIPVQQFADKKDNGIRVGAPKVYDSFLLRSKLNAAAQQLASISPWNAAAITNAYGTIQGVTRDVSYLAAQVTTTATPSIVTTNTTGSTSISPTVTQTGQCPAGYTATGISSTGVTCTLLPTQVQVLGSTTQCPPGYSASVTSASTTSTVTSTGGANPGTVASGTPVILCTQIPTSPGGSANLQTTNGTPMQNIVATTVPSVSGTVPTAPTANPLSAPTNISVSAADMLAEQVQLNAQLQMYQMLWQGSQSDQFLVKNTRAVAARAQTTIGFQISLSPPRQFNHAVAEVRVVILPHPAPDRPRVPGNSDVTVVNLLPSQKTYNVAKITSNQKAFGAGVVIEQVNVGVAGGKSKDRLYLAKDTDTVALEYPKLTAAALDPPFPEQVKQGIEETVKMQRLHECRDTWEGDRPFLEQSSIMFGWQFRPVLGADYVTAGPREVFAQLALPTTLDEDGFEPAVWVQTRWREYDEKRQVVGPVYFDSCSWSRIQDNISILNPLKVHDVKWYDVGNGTLQVVAQGEFFAPGMTVMSGGTNIPPTTFDNTKIQFFAPAHDLLQNGKIQLLGENGKTTPLSILTKEQKSCGISDASLRAVPYPDGNSRVQLKVKYEPDYKPYDDQRKELDGPRIPLLLIGSDVYGLQQRPYLQQPGANPCPESGDPKHIICTYEFFASTDSLRSAQTFLVRDPAWEFSKTSTIDIGPAFTAASSLMQSPQGDSSDASDAASASNTIDSILSLLAGTTPKPGDYAISGSGFHTFLGVGPVGYNLNAYVDQAGPVLLTSANLRILSDTMALLHLDTAPKKSLKITWYPGPGTYSVTNGLPVAWDLSPPSDSGPSDKKAVASPAFLYAGDSETVTFTADFSKVSIVDVKFEGAPLFTPKSPLAKPKNVKVPIPVSVTKIPGHKQFTVDTTALDGKATQDTMTLDLDVVKR